MGFQIPNTKAIDFVEIWFSPINAKDIEICIKLETMIDGSFSHAMLRVDNTDFTASIGKPDRVVSYNYNTSNRDYIKLMEEICILVEDNTGTSLGDAVWDKFRSVDSVS